MAEAGFAWYRRTVLIPEELSGKAYLWFHDRPGESEVYAVSCSNMAYRGSGTLLAVTRFRPSRYLASPLAWLAGGDRGCSRLRSIETFAAANCVAIHRISEADIRIGRISGLTSSARERERVKPPIAISCRLLVRE